MNGNPEDELFYEHPQPQVGWESPLEDIGQTNFEDRFEDLGLDARHYELLETGFEAGLPPGSSAEQWPLPSGEVTGTWPQGAYGSGDVEATPATSTSATSASSATSSMQTGSSQLAGGPGPGPSAASHDPTNGTRGAPVFLPTNHPYGPVGGDGDAFVPWPADSSASPGPGPGPDPEVPSPVHPENSAGPGMSLFDDKAASSSAPVTPPGRPPPSLGMFDVGVPSGSVETALASLDADEAPAALLAAARGPGPRPPLARGGRRPPPRPRPGPGPEPTPDVPAGVDRSGGIVLGRQPDGMGGFAPVLDLADLCRPRVAPGDMPPPPPTIGPRPDPTGPSYPEPSDPTPPPPPPPPTTGGGGGHGGGQRRRRPIPGLPGLPDLPLPGPGDSDTPTPGGPPTTGDRYAHPCELDYTMQHQAFRLDILAPGSSTRKSNTTDSRTFMWSLHDPIPLTAVAQDLHVLYLKCKCSADGTQAETPVCMQALIDYQWHLGGRGFFVPYDRGRAALRSEDQAVLFEPALPSEFEGTVTRVLHVVASHSKQDAAKLPSHDPISAKITLRLTRVPEEQRQITVNTEIDCVATRYISGTSDTPGMFLPDPRTTDNEVLVRVPRVQLRVTMTVEITGYVWNGKPVAKAGSCTPIPNWTPYTRIEGVEPRKVQNVTRLRNASTDEYVVLSAGRVGKDSDLLHLKCERGGNCTQDDVLDPPLEFRDSLVYWWELQHVPDNSWRARRVGRIDPYSPGGGGTPRPFNSLGWPEPEELDRTGSFPFGSKPTSSPSFGSIIWRTPKTPGLVVIRLFVGNRFRLLQSNPAYVEQQPIVDQAVDPPYQLAYEQVVRVRRETNTGAGMAIAWVGQNLAPRPTPSIQPPFQTNPGGQTMRGDVELYYNMNRGGLPNTDLYWFWDEGEGEGDRNRGWTIRKGDPGDNGEVVGRVHPWTLAIEGLAESHNPLAPPRTFANRKAVLDYAEDLEYRGIFILSATVEFRRGRVIGIDLDDAGRDGNGTPIIYANPGWTPMRWPSGFTKWMGAAKTLTQCGHQFACSRSKSGDAYHPGILKTRKFRDFVADDRRYGPAVVEVGELGGTSLRLRFRAAVRLGDVGNCVSKIVANRSAPWVPVTMRLSVGPTSSAQRVVPERRFPNWRFYGYNDGRFTRTGELVPRATRTFNPAATFMNFGDKARGEEDGI